MRRAVFYLFYDPQGQVDDYVLHTLGHLRAQAEHIFVVCNSPLDDANRARLDTVADTVWERENVGFDVWAYKEAMHVHGADRLADYDEIILMNCTFFGPVGSFDDLFADMDRRTDVDFWGITEHAERSEHPYEVGISLDAHIQSHWIAARRGLVASEAWRTYWDEMPMITSYEDSISRHEGKLTAYFLARGFTHAVAYPSERYGSDHPIMDLPALLIREGCPIVKRRSFFHDPLYNEKHANDGRQILRLMAERGYPVEMIYANLARTSKPRSLVTNLGLLEVLPEVDLGYDESAPLRVVAIAHLYYPDMTDEIVDRLDHLPGEYDLVVTTADEERKAAIEDILAGRGRKAEVRIVGSNRGRDISAFFVDCRDVLERDDYDIVVKVHSKRSPQDGPNIGELFKRHLLENLLSSPGYAANVLRLFQQHPSLGMVFPPIYHIGYPTLGHAWFTNKDAAEDEAKELGIHVPFDDTTPVSAYGSMFVARPETLRAITQAGYRHEDFPEEGEYGDGALSHVIERLMSYAVLSSGHHIREVLNAELAAVNYSFLEYRAIQIGAELPAYPGQQLNRIRKLKQFNRRAKGGGAAKRGNAQRAGARAEAGSARAGTGQADPQAAKKGDRRGGVRWRRF